MEEDDDIGLSDIDICSIDDADDDDDTSDDDDDDEVDDEDVDVDVDDDDVTDDDDDDDDGAVTVRTTEAMIAVNEKKLLALRSKLQSLIDQYSDYQRRVDEEKERDMRRLENLKQEILDERALGVELKETVNNEYSEALEELKQAEEANQDLRERIAEEQREHMVTISKLRQTKEEAATTLRPQWEGEHEVRVKIQINKMGVSSLTILDTQDTLNDLRSSKNILTNKIKELTGQTYEKKQEAQAKNEQCVSIEQTMGVVTSKLSDLASSLDALQKQVTQAHDHRLALDAEADHLQSDLDSMVEKEEEKHRQIQDGLRTQAQLIFGKFLAADSSFAIKGFPVIVQKEVSAMLTDPDVKMENDFFNKVQAELEKLMEPWFTPWLKDATWNKEDYNTQQLKELVDTWIGEFYGTDTQPSLSETLYDSELRRLFARRLEEHYCDELLHFWLDIEDFRGLYRTKKPKKRSDKPDRPVLRRRRSLSEMSQNIFFKFKMQEKQSQLSMHKKTASVSSQDVTLARSVATCSESLPNFRPRSDSDSRTPNKKNLPLVSTPVVLSRYSNPTDVLRRWLENHKLEELSPDLLICNGWDSVDILKTMQPADVDALGINEDLKRRLLEALDPQSQLSLNVNKCKTPPLDSPNSPPAPLKSVTFKLPAGAASPAELLKKEKVSRRQSLKLLFGRTSSVKSTSPVDVLKQWLQDQNLSSIPVDTLLSGGCFSIDILRTLTKEDLSEFNLDEEKENLLWEAVCRLQGIQKAHSISSTSSSRRSTVSSQKELSNYNSDGDLSFLNDVAGGGSPMVGKAIGSPMTRRQLLVKNISDMIDRRQIHSRTDEDNSTDSSIPLSDANHQKGILAPGSVSCLLEVDNYIWIGCSGSIGMIRIVQKESGIKTDKDIILNSGRGVKTMLLCKNHVWVGCDDNRLRVFQSDKPHVDPREFIAHDRGPITKLIAVGRTVWSLCGTDQSVRIWQRKSSKPSKTIRFTSLVTSLHFPSSSMVWIGTSQGVTRYNASTAKLMSTSLVTEPRSMITAITSIHFPSHVWTAHSDNFIAVWNTESGRFSHKFDSYCRVYDMLCLGKTVWTSHWDKKIRQWDSRTGELHSELTGGHDDAITCLNFAISSSGLRVWSGSDDKTVSVWNSPYAVHSFSEVNFSKAGYCFYCAKTVWGSALQCSGCQYSCHIKCFKKIPAHSPCQEKPSPSKLKVETTPNKQPTAQLTNSDLHKAFSDHSPSASSSHPSDKKSSGSKSSSKSSSSKSHSSKSHSSSKKTKDKKKRSSKEDSKNKKKHSEEPKNSVKTTTATDTPQKKGHKPLSIYSKKK